MVSLLLLPALLLALLVVPRPVAPSDIPLPRIDWQQWRRERVAMVESARSARASRLSFDVRVVGELVVRWGRAEYEQDTEQLRELRGRLDAAAERALQQAGPAPLKGLRAVQCDAFVAMALGERERGEDASAPLLTDARRAASSRLELAWAELGGRLAREWRGSGWWSAATEAELWAACLVRWSALTGLERHAALGPSPEAMKLLFHLRHRAVAEAPVVERVARWLEMIAGLEPYDAEYPVAYARGIGFYLISDYAAAFAEFRRHLQRYPNGPWTLRARNHAQASAEALSGAGG